MGYFRLFLAVAVVYGHAVGLVGGWGPGDVAVMSFLVISGYTNTLLIARYYPKREDKGWFYLDKIIRIYPLYLFYLVVTLICIFSLHLADSFNRTQTPLAWVLNFLLVPLDYYEFIPPLTHALYIPQAWTLGLELTFYLVLPLILLAPKPVMIGLIAASIGVAMLALFGVINSYTYGYHLLPGLLFVFMAGAAVASPVVPRWVGWLGVAVGIAGLVVCFYVPALANMPHNKEVMGGTVIGIVAVALLSRRRLGRLDAFAGNLSYGVYLNHWLLLILAGTFGYAHWLVFPLAVALAALTYLGIERPIINWRHKVRQAHLRDMAPTQMRAPTNA